MCWPHWRRVPKALNRAIFDTYAYGPIADYRANVAEAARVIQEKEAPRPHECARDCSAELIADVKHNGTCLRGWCPHVRSGGHAIGDSDGDDGA